MTTRMFASVCLCVFAVLATPPAAGLGQTEGTYRGKTVDEWIARLADNDIRTRWCAAYALGQMGPQAAAAIEPLAAIVADKYGHEYVRGGAAWALAQIARGDSRMLAEPPSGGLVGKNAPVRFSGAVIERLTQTLQSKPTPVVSVRRNLPLALASAAEAAMPAVPHLLTFLDDEDSGVRANAAVALWEIARHERAIPALIEMLENGSGAAPYEAAVALGGKDAVSALVRALGHRDPDVCRAAARSLGQIGPATLPAIEAALADPNEQVRRYAVQALGWVGPPALPTLITALKNPSPSARLAAAHELGRSGPQARSARPALIEAVDDADPQVRSAAAWALKRIGQGGSEPSADADKPCSTPQHPSAVVAPPSS